jgi:hypothetical protein
MGPTRPGSWLPHEDGAIKLNRLGTHVNASSLRDYRFPAGPGPLGRHGPGPKKPGTSTTRHGLRRATGWPGTRVGSGLGRILGTAARH